MRGRSQQWCVRMRISLSSFTISVPGCPCALVPLRGFSTTPYKEGVPYKEGPRAPPWLQHNAGAAVGVVATKACKCVVQMSTLPSRE